MNFDYLNKKWTSYFNWTVIYPSLFLILVFFGFIGSVFLLFNSGINNDINLLIGEALGFSFGAILLFIFLGFGIFIYIVWYFLASDTLFKLLNFNRLLWNIINIVLFFSGLYFITLTILWFKIKELYVKNGINCSFSGKIKK